MLGFFGFVALALIAWWAFNHWDTVKSLFAKATETPSKPADPPAPSSSDDNSAPPGNAPPAA